MLLQPSFSPPCPPAISLDSIPCSVLCPGPEPQHPGPWVLEERWQLSEQTATSLPAPTVFERLQSQQSSLWLAPAQTVSLSPTKHCHQCLSMHSPLGRAGSCHRHAATGEHQNNFQIDLRDSPAKPQLCPARSKRLLQLLSPRRAPRASGCHRKSRPKHDISMEPGLWQAGPQHH